jgi:hypothetical protein
MNAGRKAAERIAPRRRAFAEATVAAQYARNPSLVARYGEGGRTKCVRDTEYLVSYLAASIAYDSPSLFAEYIRWSRSVMEAFGVRSEDVQESLVCLRSALRKDLPLELSDATLPYVDLVHRHR